MLLITEVVRLVNLKSKNVQILKICVIAIILPKAIAFLLLKVAVPEGG